jgi:hypothetical protein
MSTVAVDRKTTKHAEFNTRNHRDMRKGGAKMKKAVGAILEAMDYMEGDEEELVSFANHLEEDANLDGDEALVTAYTFGMTAGNA